MKKYLVAKENIQKFSPFPKPLMCLRYQRLAGGCVDLIQVSYAYGGVAGQRHTTLREEVNLTTGEVFVQLLHGRRAASCVR